MRLALSQNNYATMEMRKKLSVLFIHPTLSGLNFTNMKKLLGIILLTVLVVFSSCNSNTDAFLTETSPQLFVYAK